jgi:hypothetical protein
MNRLAGIAMSLMLGLAAVAMAADDGTTVRTGWFSDEKCAVGRVANGTVGPNNRDCVQKCLREGAKMVFVDEKAKAVFSVENPEVARGQESHYVQASGVLDESAKTFRLASVKVLDEYHASCAAPKKQK